jgi:hypothetical protein
MLSIDQEFEPVPLLAKYEASLAFVRVVCTDVSPEITIWGLIMMLKTRVAVSPSESVTVTVSTKVPEVSGVVNVSCPLPLIEAKALAPERAKVLEPVPLSTVKAVKVLEVKRVVA